MNWILIQSLLIGCCLLGVIGCGKGDNSASMIADLNSCNAKRLGNLYSLFQNMHDFKGPKDEAELKEFIKTQSPARLKKGGIDIGNIDELFISERDGQPFKIRWGMNTRVRGPSQPVVFEAEGVEGKRQVGFTASKMLEADAAEYDRLWTAESEDLATPQSERGDGKK
jgi:hypothetical protein